jgi:hypothetical protein
MSEYNDYFNIQDIMATQERVSCKFEVGVPQMGKNKNIFLISAPENFCYIV